MIHKLLIYLCTLQHDINQQSIIKAKYKTYQIQHFILKNSLLSCYFEIEAMINAFLRNFYLNLNNHYKVKIVPTVFISNLTCI